jgi:hypothetical protein
LKKIWAGRYFRRQLQTGGPDYPVHAGVQICRRAFPFPHAGDKDAMRTQAEVTKWFTVAGATGMLGILLFLDVVKYFIAPKYHGGLHVVPVLLMANLSLGVYYDFSVCTG